MANDPDIINSDGELLAVIAAGDCDLGLTNHYYLGRALLEDPDFPVAPAWPDQDGAGAHTNVSGRRGRDLAPTSPRTPSRSSSTSRPPTAEEQITAGSEFAANPAVPPPAHIADWADVKMDPIAVNEAGPPARRRGRADARGRLELTAAAAAVAAPTRPSARVPAWSIVSARRWRSSWSGRCSRCRPASSAGSTPSTPSPAPCSRVPSSTACSSASGSAPAPSSSAAGWRVLVSFYDFPGRRWLDWALVLPMAMPAYVLVFVVLGQYGVASPLQSNLLRRRPADPRAPHARSGAIVILTAVLYPYVYVLGRSAFLGQSRQALEAARVPRAQLRAGGAAASRVPLARPALAAGASLAVMEALADFGTVDLLGIQALTSAIYRVWYGAFDQDAALQLATVLVGLALMLVTFERALRGRARYHQALGRGDAIAPRPLRGAPALARAPAGLVAAAGGVRAARRPARAPGRWRRSPDGDLDPNLGQRGAEHGRPGAAGRHRRRHHRDGHRRRPARPPLALRRRPVPASRPWATPCRAPWSRSRCTSRWSASTGGSPTGPRTCWASTPA